MGARQPAQRLLELGVAGLRKPQDRINKLRHRVADDARQLRLLLYPRAEPLAHKLRELQERIPLTERQVLELAAAKLRPPFLTLMARLRKQF